MSKRNHHTDQAFRRILKQYQEAPPEGVWIEIRDSLNRDRRKTGIVWITRIAASAALILAAGSAWMILRQTPERELAESGAPETIQEQLQQGPASVEVQDGPGTGKEIPPEPAQGKPGTRPEIQAFLAQQAPGTGREPGSAENVQGIPETGRDEPVMLTDGASMLRHLDGKYMDRLQAERPGTEFTLAVHTASPVPSHKEEGIDVFEEFGDNAGFDKWAVGGQVSPIYSYRNVDAATQAASAPGYYNDMENGILSYAGGVNVNYFPSKRLSLQSGIYYSRMGLSISNTYLASINNEDYLVYFPPVQQALANSTGKIELGGVKTNTFLSQLKPSRETATGASPSFTDNWSEQDVREGELLQHFEYLEIPMILRYRLVDRRIGLNLLGGLSTNFLVGNNVYFEEGGDREYIGTTDRIKPVNYSSIVGLGFQYAIKRNFHLNLEPTFRYYMNSINSGPGIGSHPYSLGFFTGVSYSF